MNKPSLLFIYVFSFLCFGQNQIDTLAIEFNSDFEKLMILNTITKVESQNDFMYSLFSIDTAYTEVKADDRIRRIDEFIITLKSNSKGYKPKKKIKYIFNEVHDAFFEKYEIDASFPDIFESKTYNCVSASALYSYIFKEFGIPYQIKETPTHVFLVAYPYDHNIYVETTVPGKSGSYAPSETILRKAVDELVSLKLITKEHLNVVGYNKAYNDYFYGDENIEMNDLIGIQYYNKAISEFNDKNYKRAYSNIYKSKQYYHNEKLDLFEEGLLGLIIDKLDFKNVDNFNWFLKFAGDNSEGEQEYLKFKLYQIIKESSWTDKEYVVVEEKINSVKNNDLKNLLLETYYSFRAERYSKLLLPKRVLEYAIKVYEINADNLTAKNYIVEAKIDGLAHKNVNESRIEELEEITSTYPFVKDFGIYNRYRILLYAFLTSNSFHTNISTKGFLYLEGLEGIIKEHGENINFNEGAVGEAYGAVGAYYYRQKDEKKAVEYLTRGLKHSPGNENIERKLRLIKNSN